MNRDANKEKLLSADLDADTVDRFCQQVESRGFKKKRALSAAVRLWLSIPNELQAHIMSGECGDDVLGGLLKYIAGNRIDVLRREFRGLAVKSTEAPEEGQRGGT